MKNDDVILEFQDVSKYYSGVKALDHVSFAIHKGETHALCGENGAGKSTLIKVLTGADHPTSGKIFYKGRELQNMTPRKTMDIGIRAIYQEFTLIPYLSVADNLFYGREITKHGIRDVKTISRKAKEFCESMGVSIDPNKKVKDLGVAEQQILEILKAISTKADLYIMDEPTASLTVKETGTFFKIIQTLQKQKATIIFISHRLEEVFELCDRYTVLTDGKHIITDDVANVNRKKLITYMVGRELGGQYPEKSFVSNEVILKVDDLNNEKVKHVSFELHKGEILGLGGLVGAGRTETARAIFGADKCTAEKIELKGKVYIPKSPEDALQKGIGLIPADRKNQGLVLGMTVKENTTLGCLDRCSARGVINRKKEKAIVSEYIKSLNIKTSSYDQITKNLSGGNQQKVVLAKMMACGCDVLIFDEPTRGIDVGAKAEIYELMRDIVQQGKAIIMISSDMPELIGMSDRIIVMHEGRISGTLNGNEFSQTRILEMASD